MSEMKNSLLRGLAFSLGVLLAVSAAVGTVALLADISDELLGILSIGILALAAYSAAHASTQLCRSKGLIQGLICGAAVYSAAFLAGLLFFGAELSEAAAIKALACILAGAAGGIKGVNTKKTGLRH